MKGKTVFFVGLGFLLWLVATIFFRLLGQFLLDPASPALVAATFVLTAPVIALAIYPAYAVVGVDAAERPAAAALVVLPGMLLDVLSLFFFGTSFPNLSVLSASADALFGAWLLWAYGLILLSGFFPRRTPRTA